MLVSAAYSISGIRSGGRGGEGKAKTKKSVGFATDFHSKTSV